MKHLFCRLVGFAIKTETRTFEVGFPPMEFGRVTRRCLRCGRLL